MSRSQFVAMVVLSSSMAASAFLALRCSEVG